MFGSGYSNIKTSPIFQEFTKLKEIIFNYLSFLTHLSLFWQRTQFFVNYFPTLSIYSKKDSLTHLKFYGQLEKLAHNAKFQIFYLECNFRAII